MSINSERVKRHRRKKAEMVRGLKDGPCVDCGVSYPYYVMQFDHVRGEKKFNLSYVTRTNVSTSRIMEEIAKCELVCANCHAERSHQRSLED